MRSSFILWFALSLVLPAGVSAQTSDRVLVVANANNAQSVALADYYISRRGIPTANRLLVKWHASDKADACTLAEYTQNISGPINARIVALGRVDYIVLCRNLPSKISNISQSVDSALAGCTLSKSANPYFSSKERFSAAHFKMYLVTRLDGRSWADSLALVDRSLAAQAVGAFALDVDPLRDGSSYQFYNDAMRDARGLLGSAGIAVRLDSTTAFSSFDAERLAGYVSWGSNDNHFSTDAFDKLRFAPGAIAETAVSTSADHLRFEGGTQSQIATLISNGATGAKGYAYEPNLRSIANPEILFMRYTTGYNLAESYYAASRFTGWQDVVVGDPLCNPYRNSIAVSYAGKKDGTFQFKISRSGNAGAALTVFYSVAGQEEWVEIPAGQQSVAVSVQVDAERPTVRLLPDSNYSLSDSGQAAPAE